MIVFDLFGSPQYISLVSCERAENSTRRQPVLSRKQHEADSPASSPPIHGTLIKERILRMLMERSNVCFRCDLVTVRDTLALDYFCLSAFHHIRVSSSVKSKTHEFGLPTGD